MGKKKMISGIKELMVLFPDANVLIAKFISLQNVENPWLYKNISLNKKRCALQMEWKK